MKLSGAKILPSSRYFGDSAARWQQLTFPGIFLGSVLRNPIVVLGNEAYVSGSGVESDTCSRPVFSRIEHLVNCLQGERRWDVLPKAHNHAGEIITTD